jgi:hypothetical protein
MPRQPHFRQGARRRDNRPLAVQSVHCVTRLPEDKLVIQGNFLHLLLYVFCGLVVAACTPTARPSQSTHVATAATAAETAAAAAVKSQPADPSQELVCTFETITGTRFRRRYCATQAERDRRQQDDRESGEKLQRKGTQVNPRPEGPGSR